MCFNPANYDYCEQKEVKQYASCAIFPLGYLDLRLIKTVMNKNGPYLFLFQMLAKKGHTKF